MKLHIRKTVCLAVLCLFYVCSTTAQPRVERRGIWLTTIYNLDYPSRSGVTTAIAERQKTELCTYLDQLKEANFNCVFFQVRCRGTVTYNSSLEPWDRCFSGRYGTAPKWDPVAFALEECHKRGMEFHAWFVTFPLGNDITIRQQGELSVLRKCPELCKRLNGEWYLDPGNPKTEEYIVSVIREFITQYKVDGIHLDYIRYPDDPKGFPDKELYAKFGKGNSLDDWRRNNITRIVTSVYDAVKSIDASVEVSSATIGRYKRASLPENKGGWTGYESVFQDAVSWLEAGKQDFVAPMLYYLDPLYSPLLRDWVKRCPENGVAAGLGASYIVKNEKDWAIGDFLDQISLSRAIGSSGPVLFRGNVIFNDSKHLRSELMKEHFRYPAVLPPIRTQEPMPEWLDKPIEMTVENVGGNKVRVSWSAPTGVTVADAEKIRYRLYAYRQPNHNNLEPYFMVEPCLWERSCEIEIPKLNGRFYLKVAPLDRFRREGVLSEAGEVEVRMN